MFQAFTNYIVYTAPDDAAVREATFWMLGGLGSAEWADVPLLACLVPSGLPADAGPGQAPQRHDDGGQAPPSPWA